MSINYRREVDMSVEPLRLKKSNCKNCYKCIRHCPVKAIRFSANQANIVGNECILCGQCFVVCPQNAKEITSDVEKVKVLLEMDGPVICSLAPSFIANYNGAGIEELREAMGKLGFQDVEETAIGATEVKTEYERILSEEKPNILISSSCHSVNLLIQKHFQSALPYLAKVISPMQAHCKDIKKRIPNAKTVFVGPCVAKKDEADHYKGIVDAVLTFEQLSNWFEEEDIIVEQKKDHIIKSKTRLFPTAGGIIHTMKKNAAYMYLVIDGVENCKSALEEIEKGSLTNCFIEMSSCVGSCIGGPVMEKYHKFPLNNFAQVNNYSGTEDFEVTMPTHNEMMKKIEYIGNKLAIPSEKEIQTILLQMGKSDPEKELNCGSCGYDSCREKAIAVYQGKADLTMCLPYLKEKAESFSDNIIGNTPNGIIVLNENLEVQQVNKAACKIANINSAADVCGEQVVRIMDPRDFLEVKKSRKSIIDKRRYLAEYNKYVDETIIYDKNYRILICIMRDVTIEERQKEKKEETSKHTIEIADKVVDKQMRIVQEIASLLGETAAETKIALTKLKESIEDE
jgi:iron only hydrogenase large subunit-like protein